MRETRLSGSVEGVMGNHDSYSDFPTRAYAPLIKKLRLKEPRGNGRPRPFRGPGLSRSLAQPLRRAAPPTRRQPDRCNLAT